MRAKPSVSKLLKQLSAAEQDSRGAQQKQMDRTKAKMKAKAKNKDVKRDPKQYSFECATDGCAARFQSKVRELNSVENPTVRKDHSSSIWVVI